MDHALFNKYSKYLIGIAVLIALLTYWRFAGIDLSNAYTYVAQEDVLHPALMVHSQITTRSVVWEFFGLINKLVMPRSIALLRAVGALIMVLNFLLLVRLVNFMLGEKFWGFLSVFLVALSPYAIVAAVSGDPAPASMAIVLLYLLALYRNEYIFAGILSGLAFAANLPGLVMFLILLLDLLQNVPEGTLQLSRSAMVRRIISASAGFVGVVALVFLYVLEMGNGRLFSIPLMERDLAWNAIAVVPLVIVNLLNIAGIIYLIYKKRFDIYRTHFHTLMLWITACVILVAQPATLNFLFALTVSFVLGMFFLQGFTSVWKTKMVTADMFVFIFAVIFLFSDMYANNIFLRDVVLSDSFQRTEAVDEVAASILSAGSDARLISNFAPAELAVKLGRKVYAVNEDLAGLFQIEDASYPSIYVARRESKADSLSSGCKNLFATSYHEHGLVYFVQVVQCPGDSSKKESK